jgi:hypothetical protein
MMDSRHDPLRTFYIVQSSSSSSTLTLVVAVAVEAALLQVSV